MKLAEAIRLGAMLKPQAFGGLQVRRRRWFWSRTVDATCALGAALEAAGIQGRRKLEHEAPGVMPRGGGVPSVVYTAPESWAVLLTISTCPACGSADEVARVIAHLNDHHRWTREAIAGWVEVVEVLEAPERVPERV